jgi:hypothetical protein
VPTQGVEEFESGELAIWRQHGLAGTALVSALAHQDHLWACHGQVRRRIVTQVIA